ncbi:O-antigen ligase family protein [Ornithinimicrobium pratense]|nr:O-antigen ligase family protein [Ornithinimicrobium pratense]
MILGLAANLLSGHSHRLGLPISPDRILIPLALILLWRDPNRTRARWGAVATLMVLFVAWTLASMIWHGNLLTPSTQFALLDRTVMPFVMFLVGPLIFSTTGRRDLLLKGLTAMGLYLGVTAVLEVFAPQLVFPRYIVDPEVGMHFGRARGPFAGAEAMAMTLAVCMGAALVLAGRQLPRWSTLGLIVAPLALFGVVLTGTRSAWLGVAAGILVALVLSPALRRWIPAMLIAGTSGVVGAMIFLPSLVQSIFERSAANGPIYDRLSSNAAAFRVISDLPLTGIGWRRFYPHGSEWARQSDALPMNNAVIEVHSVILSRATELGLPAVVVFLLIIVLGPLRSAVPTGPIPGHPDLPGWRALSGYAVSVWLVAGLFGPLSNPMPNYSVWLIAGVASWGLTTWATPAPKPPGGELAGEADSPPRAYRAARTTSVP